MSDLVLFETHDEVAVHEHPQMGIRRRGDKRAGRRATLCPDYRRAAAGHGVWFDATPQPPRGHRGIGGGFPDNSAVGPTFL